MASVEDLNAYYELIMQLVDEAGKVSKTLSFARFVWKVVSILDKHKFCKK